MKSDLSKEEKQARKELFGKFSEGFRSVKAYTWKFNDGKRLTEIPVTTMPIIKMPFHLSYLIYLGNISMNLMLSYLKTALLLCNASKTPISFLLHPLDIIGGDQITELSFFPGMNVSSDKKVKIFKKVLSEISKYQQLEKLSSFHENLVKQNKLPEIVVP